MPSAIDHHLQVMAELAEERERRAKLAAEAAAHQLQAASSALVGIQGMIREFEASLNADEEVMLLIVGGPAGEEIFPASISASGPDRIIFTGLTGRDNSVCMLIQHVSQLNLMLKASKVQGRPARRVFELMPDEDIPALGHSDD